MRVPIESDSSGVEYPVSRELELARDLNRSSAKTQLAKEKAENKRLREELDLLRDKMLRALADSDNLLKAREKELASERKRLNKSIMMDLLQTLDAMDAAMKATDNASVQALRDQLLSVLSRHGLKEIEAKGKKYDPFLHEVLGVSQEGDEGTVTEEIQKGYMLGDEVLRTSKVIVTKR
ncbi:MAG: nucleotide exchange factor GrpE [Candidatus Thermoplasmatota archaeon]|jgi:molecular chaperone GrpE|nr:nucleotide exchange factor GrpE [Candidatus Thermoplasmatota archaeon]MCL5800575.1 nucleotide exchange factor GrpE [Candidatus Thermoplasmatota archaeon]